MKNYSFTKTAGRLITKSSDLFIKREEPKIFVKEEFRLADCHCLKNISALLVKNIGITSPAMLQILNSGIPYLIVPDLKIRKKIIMINGQKFQDGDLALLDFQNKIVSKTSRLSKINDSIDSNKSLKDFFCFISNVNQTPDAILKAEGVAVRSEDLISNNKESLKFFKNFLDGDKPAIKKFASLHALDWENVFSGLGDRPIMIRLFDSALSDLFPTDKKLQEKNIQLGNRGCRLFFSRPEIYEFQLRAIFSAAKKVGYQGNLMLAVPIVSIEDELLAIKKKAFDLQRSISPKTKLFFGFTLETPRAVLLLDKLSKHVDFINLGLNDLTQLMFGFGRDDINSFLPAYFKKGVLEDNPFLKPDQVVWNFVERALDKTKKDLPIFVPVFDKVHWNLWKKLLSGRKNVKFLCRISF